MEHLTLADGQCTALKLSPSIPTISNSPLAFRLLRLAQQLRHGHCHDNSAREVAACRQTPKALPRNQVRNTVSHLLVYSSTFFECRLIQMNVRSNQDITNQAVLEVSDRLLYDIENNRAPYNHGPLDPRLVSPRALVHLISPLLCTC